LAGIGEILIISTPEDISAYEKLLGDGSRLGIKFTYKGQPRQGFYISCLEEIAWRRGFINGEQLKTIGENLKMTDYGQYILSLLNEE
jgi:glucose-1-phosphate thymidylyltransferase